MDKLEELRQKIEAFQAKSAAKGEIQAFITLAVSVLKKYKETFESISSENLSQIQDAVSSLEKQKTEILSNVDKKASVVAKDFASSLQEIKKLLSQIQAIKATPGEPGKDADEEKIVEEVLSKIKLPEYPEPKEVVLDDGKQIADKLNQLEEVIEQKTIKGLVKKIADISSNIAHGAVEKQAKLYTGVSETRVRELLARAEVWHTSDGITTHKLSVQATAPTNPIENDLWFDIS